MATLLHQWTVEDYHRIIEAGVLAQSNCELIRGEIVDMAPEGPEHADFCESSARYLERLFGEGWQSRQGKPITLKDSEPQGILSNLVYEKIKPHLFSGLNDRAHLHEFRR